VIDQLNKQYEKTSSSLVNGLKKLEDFKQEISIDLIDLVERADVIKQKFRKFVESDDNKINDCPLLIKGDKFFINRLQIPTKDILDGIDEYIKIWGENLKYLLSEKERRIQKVQKTLNSMLKEGLNFFHAFKPSTSNRLNIAESLKTIRKLEAFGQSESPPDFEWPRPQDLEAFPTQEAIRLVGLEYKEIDCEKYKGIGGLQLIFTSGIKSPVFLAQGAHQLQTPMIKANYDATAKVMTIRGDVKGFVVKQLYFHAVDGKEIARIFTFKDNDTQARQLQEGEEIIGFYGHGASFKCFRSLGFLVWKPVFS
jgi:hypothetical protein